MKLYNIRVYAVVLWNGNVLVTDEYRMGMEMTKFPGGGHEWGEGLAETVMRECEEELFQRPVSVEHFYTTDFFIASAFNEKQQLISVYYKVTLPQPESVSVSGNAFEFPEKTEGAQIFRWLPLDQLTPSDFTFPIDKRVAEMLSAAD